LGKDIPVKENDPMEDPAVEKLEKEIRALQVEIEQTMRVDGYKRRLFYPLALVISVLFTLASLWAWYAYDVVIWAVFVVVGVLVSIAAATAVRMQEREYREQTKRLEEMIRPYRAALERKEKELSALRVKE
jgi:uncharacterized membrane protein